MSFCYYRRRTGEVHGLHLVMVYDSLLVLWEAVQGRKPSNPHCVVCIENRFIRKIDVLFATQMPFYQEEILGFPRVLAFDTFLPDFWTREQVI